MENCTARRIRKTLTDGSYRFASKSLHSDPKWPFTATLPVNSNTNLLVAESPAVLRETWEMGEGGIHHLSRKVRSPLSVQISLTHSLAAFCCSPARTTETESQFKPEIKSPEKKKTDPSRRGAVCNGGRATSHSLFSLLANIHCGATRIGVYGRLLEH